MTWKNGYEMLNAFVGLNDATLVIIGISIIGHRSILVCEAAKLAKYFM
jgi:hypothetical protein